MLFVVVVWGSQGERSSFLCKRESAISLQTLKRDQRGYVCVVEALKKGGANKIKREEGQS